MTKVTISIRTNLTTKQQLQQIAQKQNRKLSNFIDTILQNWLRQHQKMEDKK